jgi:hypothetical protein
VPRKEIAGPRFARARGKGTGIRDMEHMPRAAARRNSEATERKFSLPLGYRVTFCWQPGEHFQLRWCPDVPLIRKARAWRKFFEAYQAARRSFLEEVAAVIGGDVSILDIRAQKRRRAETVPSRHSIEVIGHAPVESRRP